MKIKQVQIKNFRGIHDITLNLHEKANALMGINGSGKSSILDAIDYLLTPLVNIASENKQIIQHSGNDFPETEIRITQDEAHLEITLIKKGMENLQYELQAKIDFYQHDKSPSRTQFLVSHTNTIKKYLISSRKPGNGYCIFVYYPTSRFVNEVPLHAWHNRDFHITDAYKDALNTKTNFHEFFEWFRNRLVTDYY